MTHGVPEPLPRLALYPIAIRSYRPSDVLLDATAIIRALPHVFAVAAEPSRATIVGADAECLGGLEAATDVAGSFHAESQVTA